MRMAGQRIVLAIQQGSSILGILHEPEDCLDEPPSKASRSPTATRATRLSSSWRKPCLGTGAVHTGESACGLSRDDLLLVVPEYLVPYLEFVRGGCRESPDGWKAFLLSLRARGVDGVTCVTSDAHEDLKRAIVFSAVGVDKRECGGRVVLQDAQARADKWQKIQIQGRGEAGGVQIHRALSQQAAVAFQERIYGALRLRARCRLKMLK